MSTVEHPNCVNCLKYNAKSSCMQYEEVHRKRPRKKGRAGSKSLCGNRTPNEPPPKGLLWAAAAFVVAAVLTGAGESVGAHALEYYAPTVIQAGVLIGIPWVLLPVTGVAAMGLGFTGRPKIAALLRWALLKVEGGR